MRPPWRYICVDVAMTLPKVAASKAALVLVHLAAAFLSKASFSALQQKLIEQAFS